ncbi:MAG: ribbon-helix-helix protein, CopG family [Gammaproteobacteria bacterium]|nr:ribbon-helix-helix protein, CopG family [Gammaproteobacteria bacterium]
MANLSVRRLDDETVGRLKTRAAREGVSLEETVRRALRAAVADEEPIGAMIRRHVGAEGADIELPDRELDAPIDFSTDQYDPGKQE